MGIQLKDGTCRSYRWHHTKAVGKIKAKRGMASKQRLKKSEYVMVRDMLANASRDGLCDSSRKKKKKK